MRRSDLEYLCDDLEWRGVLGTVLLERMPVIEGASLFTMPREVKENGLDFRYGHYLHGGLEELLRFVVSWLGGGQGRFCISHDLCARRGDPCLISLASRMQRCGIVYHGDEVYYVARACSMPDTDELLFYLRHGNSQMLMCMGNDREDLNSLKEVVSYETLGSIARNCDYVVRGICDDEGFAVVSFCETAP